MDSYYQLLLGYITTYVNDILFDENVDAEKEYETFRNQHQIDDNVNNLDITELEKEKFYHKVFQEFTTQLDIQRLVQIIRL